MLDGEHAPGAREAGLDLVNDEHDAVLVAQRAQLAQELRRRCVKSAFAEHGLNDDGGHARRIQVRLEELLERREGVLHRHAVIGDGEGQVIDLGQHRPEARLVGQHFAGEADARERAAMEAARERDQRRAARVVARDLDGILNRLRAGGEKNRLLGRGAGRGRVQALGECDIALVGRHLKAGVHEALELCCERRFDLGMQMARVEHGDAAGEVDEAPPLDVPQFRVRAAIGVDRQRVRDAARHCALAALV
jgi:hypothetical protein